MVARDVCVVGEPKPSSTRPGTELQVRRRARRCHHRYRRVRERRPSVGEPEWHRLRKESGRRRDVTVTVTFADVAWGDYFINGEKQVYRP